jgi:putative ABC transport system permease protein
MLALITANVRRRRGRTFLTSAGVAVGVAAVVALLALSEGLNETAAQFVHLGGANLGLFQRDAGDPTSSVVPLSMLARVRRQPEVADATPIQLVIGAVPHAPSAIVLGLDPAGFAAHQLVITSGRGVSRGEVAIGDLLATQLHLQPGSEIRIGGRQFPITGIFHTGLSYEDTGAAMALADAQMIAGRTPDEVTTLAVRLSPAATASTAEAQLARAFPGLIAIGDPGEAARAGANTILITKAVLLMVVLALIIGGLAVANAMLAALLERRRELGLLATLGWSARQLGLLVLGEALAVSMLGTAAGLLLGLAASKLLPAALGLGGFVSPVLTAWGVGRAVLIGLAIGTLGAIYPTWRVSRIRPVLALANT